MFLGYSDKSRKDPKRLRKATRPLLVERMEDRRMLANTDILALIADASLP